MARPLRIEYEGAFYHVTSRGNERGKVFFEAKDYEKFKDYLKGACEKFGIVIHAYVLMTNHYHLLIETPEANLSRAMHYINGAYTSYLNMRKKRSGHLFQGRYKSIIVDSDSYLLELSRYLHLNPVSAGMVDKPADYPYSSCNAYLTSGKEDVVHRALVWGMLSTKKREAPARYREFVENMEAPQNTFKEVYGGMALGSIDFIKGVLARVEEDISGKREISNRKALTSPSKTDGVIDGVASYYNIKRDALFEGGQNHYRKIVIYLLNRYTGASNPEIGELFGISYSAVAKVCQRLSRQMERDKQLRVEVERLELKLSTVKG